MELQLFRGLISADLLEILISVLSGLLPLPSTPRLVILGHPEVPCPVLLTTTSSTHLCVFGINTRLTGTIFQVVSGAPQAPEALKMSADTTPQLVLPLRGDCPTRVTNQRDRADGKQQVKRACTECRQQKVRKGRHLIKAI